MSLGQYCKAYIPPERKPIHVGALHWVWHLTRGVHVAYTNMLVSKKPCGPNAKPHGPNVSPSPSWWNIVCVGYAMVWFMLAMKISCCLCQLRAHWVANANVVSGGIWA